MMTNTDKASFRQFYPLNRLNTGIFGTINKDLSKPLEPSLRYKRFAACKDSFDRNTIRLHRLLDSIAKHFNVSYNSKDRKQPYQHQIVKNHINLENDLLLFFTILKMLLDDMAFFVPFYFQQPLRYSRSIPDLRDAERPPSFNGLKGFLLRHEDIDKDFASILRRNEEWTNEICSIRNFLIHRFHDLSVNNDWWTHACFAFISEFHRMQNFIPDIFTYVAKSYYSFVKFTTDFEEHFTGICQDQFSDFEYFDAGHAYANRPGKTHLFFAGLGRLLENKILIRIHPEQRCRSPKILEYFMREEKIVCNTCGTFKTRIQPTVEHYVIISSFCGCAKSLPIPLRVEKKFYPPFLDQNQQHILDQLIPH